MDKPENYSIDYESLGARDLPTSQKICEGLDLETAFGILTQQTAEEWLRDCANGHTSTAIDRGYTVKPQF